MVVTDLVNTAVVVNPYYWEYTYTRSGWRDIWFRLNACWYNNTFIDQSYHDDVLVARLSISESMVNIYRYLCRILTLLSNKVNRLIFILHHFESINISSWSMKKWGWYKNDISLCDISLSSYQERVTIKIPHAGQWFMRGTEDKNPRHRFHITTGSSHTYSRR